MQVLRSRHFQWCALVVVGVALLSTGCRSTRNSLSTLPGMSWVGSQGEASFNSMASEEDKPMLPPPSREATPQVVTSDEPSPTSPAKGSYPDTGFPSPIGPRNAPAMSAQGDVAGSEMLGGADRGTSATDPSSGGATQRGFYGEQYQGDRPSSVAGGGSAYEPPAGAFDSPSGANRESEASPTRSWGGPAPTSGLSTADPGNQPAGNSPYQQIRDGLRDDWRNTTSAVTRSAEQVTEQAEDFVQGTSEELRQGVDSIRDGVRSQYQEFTQGVAAPVDATRPDASDRLQDYAPAVEEADSTPAVDAVSSWGSSSPSPSAVPNGTTSQGTYPSTSAPSLPGYGATATLNPPSADSPAPSSFDGYSSDPVGPRSNEPWRPGSTSDYRQTPAAPSGASSGTGRVPNVEPVSYDRWDADTDPAPTHGWSSQSQRLSPTYR